MDLQIIWTRLREMGNDFLELLPNMAIGLVVFALFYLVARGISGGVFRLAQRRRSHRNLALALGRVTQIVVIIVGMLVALSIVLPTFSPGDMIQLLGISSVAIGFAFRDILQNFLAGILLLLTEPFRIGDQIIVNDFEGTVENIEARATTLKTYDGRRVVIPNADMFTQSVIVNTAFDKIRLQYDVAISYADDIERAKRLIHETLHELPGVLHDPAPETFVVDLADFSVNIRVRWWITPPRKADTFEATDAVLTAIKNKLDASGVTIPFPTQMILFQDHTGGSDGDGAAPRGIGAALLRLAARTREEDDRARGARRD